MMATPLQTLGLDNNGAGPVVHGKLPIRGAPSAAMQKAWAERSKHLKAWERELFEVHAKRDLTEYISQAEEYCQKYKMKSWSQKIVDMIEPLFTSLRMYTIAIAGTVSAYPSPATPVLGGLMCILQVSANYAEYQERIAKMMARMGDRAPTLMQYDEEIYRTDEAVQASLVAVYGDMLDFSRMALNLFMNSKGEPKSTCKLWGLAIWKPYEAKLGGVVAQFERHLDLFEDKALQCDRKRQLKMNTFHLQNAELQRRDLAMVSTVGTSISNGLNTLIGTQQQNVERDRLREESLRKQLEREIFGNSYSSLILSRKLSADQHTEEKRRKIIRWLPSTQYLTDHKDKCYEHLEGTGQWLLNERYYTAFTAKDSSDLLWINGKPGSGKSVLAALTVCDLELAKDLETSVVYVYCKRSESRTGDFLLLLCTLLKQLCQQSSNIESTPKEIFDMIDQSQPPKLSQVKNLFLSTLTHFKETFLIIDGLDECEECQGFTNFLPTLMKLSTATVKILVFSRPNQEAFEIAFKGYQAIAVDSDKTEEDVKSFITSIVTIETLRVGGDQSILQSIKDSLLAKADGMFLWVKLLVSTLKQKSTARQLLTTIDAVPKGLEDMYELCLQRIWNQDDDREATFRRDAAFRVLIWAMEAERPLSLEEMIEAVAIEPGARVLHDIDKMQPGHLIEICADLIRLDKEGNVVPVHASLQDYLSSKPRLPSRAFQHFQNLRHQAAKYLAEVCLTYISQEKFTEGPCITEEELTFLHQKRALLKYLAKNWAVHVRKADRTAIREVTTRLANCEGPRELLMQSSILLEGKFYQCRSNTSSLHFVSMYDLFEVVDPYCIDFSAVMESDGFGFGPLLYALLWKNESACCFLLHHIEKLSACHGWLKCQRDFLHFAAIQDWPEIIEMLVRNGCDPNLHGLANSGVTPLMSAVIWEKKASITRLLAGKADINVVDDDGKTALFYAVPHEDLDIMRILIGAGADVNIISNLESVLHSAVAQGNPKMVELLLHSGANPNARTQDVKILTPLHVAATLGRLACFEILLDHGAQLHARDGYGHTTLHLAVMGNKRFVLDTSCEKHPDSSTHTADNTRRTYPYHPATGGHLDIIKILREDVAEIDVLSSDGHSPLHYAVLWNQLDIAKLLLEMGADVNVLSPQGWCPLLFASVARYVDMVKLLLEAGADNNILGSAGKSPLQQALLRGYLDIVKLLVGEGAKISIEECVEIVIFEMDRLRDHHGSLTYIIPRDFMEVGWDALENLDGVEVKVGNSSKISEHFRRAVASSKVYK